MRERCPICGDDSYTDCLDVHVAREHFAGVRNKWDMHEVPRCWCGKIPPQSVLGMLMHFSQCGGARKHYFDHLLGVQ